MRLSCGPMIRKVRHRASVEGSGRPQGLRPSLDTVVERSEIRVCLQADVGRRLGRTFSLLEEVALVTDQ